MEIYQLIGVGVSSLGLLGGLFSYVLGLRIKNEIQTNNEQNAKDLAAHKEKNTAAINALRDELVREFGTHTTRIDDKLEAIERQLTELSASLNEKVLGIVNGKYVRTDLHQQSIASIQERFTSMKELIEVNLEKIEQGLDRQILDLKDRILHTK